MNLTLIKQYRILFLAAFAFFFFYLTSGFSKTAPYLDLLFYKNLLNSFLFYAYKNTLFLNFDFHGIHPYYLLLSLLLKAANLGFIVQGCLLLTVFLFLKFLIKELNEYYLFFFWLVSCPLLFSHNAEAFLLWLQFIGLLLVNKKCESFEPSKTSGKINGKTVWIKTIFYVLASLLFLPGLFFLWLYDLVLLLINSSDLTKASLLSYLLSLFFSLLICLFLHYALAVFFFHLSPDNILAYFKLPFSMHHDRLLVEGSEDPNRIHYTQTVLHLLGYYKAFYFLIGYGLVLTLLNKRYKSFLIQISFIVAWLFFGFFMNYGDSAVFPCVAFFITMTGVKNYPAMEPRLRKTGTVVFTLVWLLFVVLLSIHNEDQEISYNYHPEKIRSLRSRPETNLFKTYYTPQPDENMIISYNDIRDSGLNIPRQRLKGQVILLDLKIIPENVKRIVADIKSKKLDPLLNPQTMKYLEVEEQYAKNILDNLELKNYTLCLKSKIHPGTEKPPYRRVYYFWEKLKTTGSRLILF